MRQPIFVRSLTDRERQVLTENLRSPKAFVLRRCQIVLASAAGQRASQIARQVGCDDQTVREVVHAFNATGLAVLTAGSTRPHTVHRAFEPAAAERLRGVLHRSPRTYGKASSLWTLALVAEVSFEQGLTAEQVSGETVRATLARLGVSWSRAKRWITSPDPGYARKKNARDRLIRLAASQPDWVVGFEDETWWSRLTPPALHTWTTAAQPLRLVEPAVRKDDPDPKALACYGVLLRGLSADATAPDPIWLRFVTGRPLSAVTIRFLDWVCHQLAAAGKRVLVLVWDNASWHVSQAVRHWLRQHNRQVKQSGRGVRLLVCPLPTKSPWLNPIEPKWLHGKRRVVEPQRLLTAAELMGRVYDTFGCAHEKPLSIPEKVV